MGSRASYLLLPAYLYSIAKSYSNPHRAGGTGSDMAAGPPASRPPSEPGRTTKMPSASGSGRLGSTRLTAATVGAGARTCGAATGSLTTGAGCHVFSRRTRVSSRKNRSRPSLPPRWNVILNFSGGCAFSYMGLITKLSLYGSVQNRPPAVGRASSSQTNETAAAAQAASGHGSHTSSFHLQVAHAVQRHAQCAEMFVHLVHILGTRASSDARLGVQSGINATDWLARTAAVQMTRSVVSMTQPRTPCIAEGFDLHESRRLLSSQYCQFWRAQHGQGDALQRVLRICGLRYPLLVGVKRLRQSTGARAGSAAAAIFTGAKARSRAALSGNSARGVVKYSLAACWAAERPVGWSSSRPPPS